MPSIPGKIRDILFGSTTSRLNCDVGKHNVARAACDDVHGVAILLLSLDLAAGKFTPETIDFNDEAAPALCGKLNLLRASLPDEHVGAFVALVAHAPERSTAAAAFGPCRPRSVAAATAN